MSRRLHPADAEMLCIDPETCIECGARQVGLAESENTF
jgi:hypothetical protein